MHEKKTGWMACTMIAVMIVYAVWNTAVVRYRLIQAEAYRIELMEQIHKTEQENDLLQWEIDHAGDAAVIERLARTRLGLVRQGEIIFVISDAISGKENK